MTAFAGIVGAPHTVGMFEVLYSRPFAQEFRIRHDAKSRPDGIADNDFQLHRRCHRHVDFVITTVKSRLPPRFRARIVDIIRSAWPSPGATAFRRNKDCSAPRASASAVRKASRPRADARDQDGPDRARRSVMTTGAQRIDLLKVLVDTGYAVAKSAKQAPDTSPT